MHKPKKNCVFLPFLGFVLDIVAGHDIHSFMDGCNMYNQVQMVEEEQEQIVFILKWGAYAYNVMPFGLCNAIVTFQKVVSLYQNDFMQVFLYDFRVFGNKNDHLVQLQKYLQECHENGISFNQETYAFYVNLGIMLRQIVCNEGLMVDPRKMMAIVNMLRSRNVIEIKRLLGATRFYQRYLQDFASKTTPMCKLLKKDETFDQTNSCTKALQWMKLSMTCFLVSIVPNWKLEFHMHIDVSNFALTTMLGQNSDNMIDCPIYYAS